MPSPHADGRAGIDAGLVRRLIAARFPRWRELPVTPVEVDGWDNRTYRLGSELTVRLPTAAGYVPAIAKEDRWLPELAPLLPVPIPRVVARGEPGDAQTREALAALAGRGVDTARAAAVWEAALATSWRGEPLWFHGDIAANNLLVRGGKLAAVLDFGTSGVGDPACDLVISWTMFTGESREAFRRAAGQDAGTWARARGWALWKALIMLARDIDADPVEAAEERRVIDEILADHALAHG